MSIGFTFASAVCAILVYVQKSVPGKVGDMARLFFGFAFGMGGIGGAVLVQLAAVSSVASRVRTGLCRSVEDRQ